MDFESFLSSATQAPADATAPPDGFEAFMRQQLQAQRTQTNRAAQATSAANATADPRAAASAAQIGRQIGMPQTVVEADPQRFQQQATIQKNAALLDANPVLSSWVAANPDSARIAHDEYDKLGAIEKGWGGIKDAGYALAQGLGHPWASLAFTANLALSNVPRIADVVRGDTAASDWWFRNFVDPAVSSVEALSPAKDAGFLAKSAHTVGSLISTLAQIGLTGPEAEAVPAGASALTKVAEAAKHAAGSMAFPSLAGAVQTGNQVLQATGDQGVAARAAVGSYLLNTAQGIVPLSAPGNLVGRLVTGAVSGAASGEAQRSVMNLLLPPEMRQNFSGEDLVLQSLTGALMGGLMGPHVEPDLRAAVRKTYTDALAAERAEHVVGTLDALGKVGAETELRKADPERFAQFVERVTDQSDVKEVFVNGRFLQDTLAQHPSDLPESVRAQIPEAAASGGDVRISVADYMTHIAGTPMGDAITPELRVDAEGPTFREGQEFYAKAVDEMKARAEDVAQRRQQDQPWRDSAQQVHDAVLEQLNATNRWPADVNRTYAPLVRDFYATQADRLGMLPHELWEAAPLSVAADGMGRLEQAARGSYEPATRTITLLKDADLSTYVHELGHAYLDLLTHITSPEFAESAAVTKARQREMGDLRKRSSVLSSLLECIG